MGTVACLIATLACAAAQRTTPTQFADFVVAGGRAYLPSAAYPVRTATADLRMKWSSDGRRLAFVGALEDTTPRTSENGLAKTGALGGRQRLSVWDRDTGKTSDIAMPDDKTGVGEFAFLGHSLLFSTFGSGERLWIAREGARPQPIELAGWEGGGRFATSRRRETVLVVTPSKMWLMDPQRTVEMKTPGYGILRPRGVTAADQAVVAAMTTAQRMVWLLVDFATGDYRTVGEEPESPATPSQRPFVLDAYQLQRRKADLVDRDEESEKLDAPQLPPVAEDRGWCLDIVERTGAKRRRVPFIPEMGRFVEVSDDGLAFAYVSNRMLMVRCLVAADRELNRRLTGG